MRALWIILAVAVYIPLSLYLFYVVHFGLGRLCVRYARKFCKRRGLEVSRARWQPDFELSDGKRLKTEFTQVQLDCLDVQKQRRLVLILAWPFGVRKLVSDEIYPESYDGQWPQKYA